MNLLKNLLIFAIISVALIGQSEGGILFGNCDDCTLPKRFLEMGKVVVSQAVNTAGNVAKGSIGLVGGSTQQAFENGNDLARRTFRLVSNTATRAVEIPRDAVINFVNGPEGSASAVAKNVVLQTAGVTHDSTLETVDIVQDAVGKTIDFGRDVANKTVDLVGTTTKQVLSIPHSAIVTFVNGPEKSTGQVAGTAINPPALVKDAAGKMTEIANNVKEIADIPSLAVEATQKLDKISEKVVS